MKLIYIGPHDAVYVPLPDGGDVDVARGESADFADDLAALLLEQPSNWQAAKAAKATPQPPAPTPDATPTPAQEG